ncbi:hypothetical protein Verru16b_02382 [Lacunisphaera limnophila]|uniref:Four-carbon acid sugar kinase N-terminal domain-containing protein n=1 Tax=Lacunisphaera limnophila TaxID=1838286 RepID=A0A1D8AWQ0_9BACT|nr:four-carbon acid sugar kinase family protein [Lacunisphaera limnophila]AOS45302.1 hypothetical protein Verru16b_02382 [Lacunisphaera limnophila]
MIVVLADDLSGAAELAGIARLRGLTAEVQSVFHPATEAAVLCVDTDTRLLPADAAARRVSVIATAVAAARPDWIFKKCDSVLRGSVLAEARAVVQATGLTRLLLVPANPSRDRVIRDGLYFVAGRPLHETSFAHDPTHPRTTSRVVDLLDGDRNDLKIPDIGSPDEVLQQATAVDSATLPVGGADFFTALLILRTSPPAPAPVAAPAAGPTLLVCGSTAAWSQRSREAATQGVPGFSLPHDSSAIAQALAAKGTVLLGIGDGPASQAQPPAVLSDQLTQTVLRVLGATRVTRLMIEGGATAAAILHALPWTRLSATQVIGDVAVLAPIGGDGPAFFIKPGSYAWPAALWWDR